MSYDEAATISVAFAAACMGLFAEAPIGLGLNPHFVWEPQFMGENYRCYVWKHIRRTIWFVGYFLPFLVRVTDYLSVANRSYPIAQIRGLLQDYNVRLCMSF